MKNNFFDDIWTIMVYIYIKCELRSNRNDHYWVLEISKTEFREKPVGSYKNKSIYIYNI